MQEATILERLAGQLDNFNLLTQNDALVTQWGASSSLLLALYAIATMVTKKGTLLVSFVLVEVYVNLVIFDVLNNGLFTIGVGFCYIALFNELVKKEYSIDTIKGVFALLVFQTGVIIDAYYSNSTSTFIYEYYLAIFICIHLYIISTLLEWQKLGRRLGSSIAALLRFCTTSDRN